MKKAQLTTVLPSVFLFLRDLKKHNNREWFAKHKNTYSDALAGMISFADNLLGEMNKHDLIETPSGKNSLYRIYKDTRFSKDKTPYKTNWAGGFKRATKQLRGGYYYHLEPGNSYMAGGFFNPNPDDLFLIRKEIEYNHPVFRKVLKSKSAFLGELQGPCLKTVPRGFDPAHPAIDLLRYKQFYFKHRFTDKEVLAPDFVQTLNKSFRQLRPFFDYMSEVLTADANGSPME
jgi:uncharacterized protein (TIGR02453 family)